MNQKEAAFQDLALWLQDERELGKIPEVMELVECFEYEDLNYYAIKYKPSQADAWLFGIAGGYEKNSLEHCGHVFSKMELFDDKNVKEKAIEMIDLIRAYWKEQAAQAEKIQNKNAEEKNFLAFVLLANAEWDWDLLRLDLEEQWHIPVKEEAERNTLIFEYENKRAVISCIDARIPNQEAEINASNNVMWTFAKEAAQAHQAQLLVNVSGEDSLLEKGKLLTEILACCSIQPNVLGIYASGTVFEPGFYEDAARLLKENELPIYNWIHFGMYKTSKGLSGYTYGLKQFGFKELEVLDTLAKPEELQQFLASLTYYVLENNIELHDGETIGFSENQKLKIKENQGVALAEITLKIEYPD